VSKKFSITAQSVSLLTLVFLSIRPGLGETCAECQRKVQSEMSACTAQLSSEGPLRNGVRFANPGKPADAERKAAADHLEKSRVCSSKAREGFANCRQTANCP
jgi:hypothetical protein